MKKIILTLAAVLCCAMAINVCTSCSNDDDASNTYKMGFDSFSYANQGDKSMTEEINVIEAAFVNAIQQNLGVTVKNSVFYYEGGVDKVQAACEKAAAELNGKTFKGHYVYSVSSTTTVYKWQN